MSIENLKWNKMWNLWINEDIEILDNCDSVYYAMKNLSMIF